jgi:hypothetical protein
MESYEVRDRDRVIHFRGELLAATSSQETGKQRWIELALYRTEAGNFVVQGIGRSLREGESDRCWAQVSDEAAGVVERLTLYDDNGVRYMPWVNERLLRTAATLDARIHEALHQEHVA